MKDLLEHVLNENYVSAQDSFESHMNTIMEKKLHEMKRDMQSEAFGGLTKQEIEARKKAGYRKASEVLGDPRGGTELSAATRKLRGIKIAKKVSVRKKKKLDEDAMTDAMSRQETRPEKITRLRTPKSGESQQDADQRVKRYQVHSRAGEIKKLIKTDPRMGMKKALRLGKAAAADVAIEKAKKVRQAIDVAKPVVKQAVKDYASKAAAGVKTAVRHPIQTTQKALDTDAGKAFKGHAVKGLKRAFVTGSSAPE